jgi:hypothetical protein
VKGYDRTDRLAVMVIEQGGTAMDRTDILYVLSDIYRISEAANVSESTAMIRLIELHVKTGSARRQQKAGMHRRIVN